MPEAADDSRATTLHLDPLAYLVGLEGLALLRAFAGEHDAAFVEERLAEVTRLIRARDRLGPAADLPALTATQGYDAWAPTYDDPGNSLLAPDLAMVTSLVGDQPGLGVALDAACGTGRYAAWLAERGYQVVGVDSSPGMLDVARLKLPGVDLRQGNLQALPVASASVDLAVCALALTHVRDLDGPYRELARVLVPGGRLVVSDTHSFFLTSRRYPLVRELPDGSFGYLPGWQHSLADHVTAALGAGFSVSRVEELTIDGVVDPGAAALDLGEAPWPDPWALMTWAAAAANAAYVGAPHAMYLQLERRG